MSQGASFHDQAILSLCQYPYLFKIVFVPLLDIYYIKKLGKSKTLITVAGTVLFLLLFFLGSNSEEYLMEKRVGLITVLWFVITVFVVLFHLGIEVWALTLFEPDRRHMGGILVNLGVHVGTVIGLNLFVLFNSKDWWNEHFFGKESKWRLEHELVTHHQFVQGTAVVLLALIVYSTLFLSEKRLDDSRTQNLKKTFKAVVGMFGNHLMLKLLIIMSVFRFLQSMFDKSNELKFIEKGYNKTTLVNFQSGILPLQMLLSFSLPFIA